MDLDAAEILEAVERTVRWLERDGQPARAVTLSRAFATTGHDLWEGATSPNRIPRWFLPVTGDLRLGGRFQLEGNAGGTVAECEPMRRFSLTWEFAGDTSWVEVHLSDDGGDRTQLTLTHTALHSEFWDTYGPGAVGVGWELAMLGLALHVADPQATMPDPAEFAASPVGRALITGSSQAWGEAAVAAGEQPEAAQAAAARTTAFYTGETAEAE